MTHSVCFSGARWVRRLVCLVALLIGNHALAWGPSAHRIVAELAERQLQPEARAQIEHLLAQSNERHLADIANWADDLRDDPAQRDYAKATARLHYVNFSDSTCQYQAERICKGGQCVVAAIKHYAEILGNTRLDDARRAEALRFLVHFVGDVHQPLHAGYRPDRGGNLMQVRIDGMGSNLHSVWDSKVTASAGLSWTRYAERLAHQPRIKDPDNDPVDWAEQSCRLTRDAGIYPDSRTIDSAYLTRMRPMAERQMRLASERLATLLNRLLD